MPTLRFGKVWQVIRHFGVYPNNFPGGQKTVAEKKKQLHFCINSLVPYVISRSLVTVRLTSTGNPVAGNW